MRLTLLLIAAAAVLPAQIHTIEGSRIRPHVQFLSNDLLEGRGVGARGGQLAVEYLAAQFAAAGLKPGALRRHVSAGGAAAHCGDGGRRAADDDGGRQAD